jgi:hypothetical protein
MATPSSDCESPRERAIPTISQHLRTAKWLVASSVPLIIVALLAAFPLMSVGACLSWPVAFAATVVAIRALAIAVRCRAEPGKQASTSNSVLMLAICLGLLLGCTFLNLLCLGAVRAASKSTLSAANLRQIGTCVRIYAEKHTSYPPSLKYFVDAELMSPRSLTSPFDPEARYDVPRNTLAYSSYIYTPGVGEPVFDPDIVIAYERDAFTACEARILSPKERWVLFGDGQVRHLADAEFDQALKQDKLRRQALGWPAATRSAE